MIKEMEDWIDEVIDDLDGIDFDINSIIDYRLAEEILKHCGIEE
jgi:hypothetical protein